MRTGCLLAGLIAVLAVSAGLASAEPREVRWGTSTVGTAGHRALVAMAELINKEMPQFRVTAQPTPGAIVTIKGYATGQFDGYYGADIGFYELANDIGRFKDFKANIKRPPVQSMWNFTIDGGLGIHARDKGKITKWRDLDGQKVFTGPLPFDVRAHIERAMAALGIKHQYMQLDLATAGSALEAGRIAAFAPYTSGQSAAPPWIAELSLTSDWAILNPSAEERAELAKKGFPAVDLDKGVFKRDVHADTVTLLPFYYGFHLGLEFSADDVHRIITLVADHAGEMAKADAGWSQMARDPVGMQAAGVAAAIDFVPVHPGLARYLREKGAWKAEWDSRVAKP